MNSSGINNAVLKKRAATSSNFSAQCEITRRVQNLRDTYNPLNECESSVTNLNYFQKQTPLTACSGSTFYTALIQIDRVHASDYCIKDIRRHVILRTLKREQGQRNRHTKFASRENLAVLLSPNELYSLMADSVLLNTLMSHSVFSIH